MHRALRRTGPLIPVIIAVLVATTGTASAAGGWLRCSTGMVWRGNTGQINAQYVPGGFLPWNVVDWVDNGGVRNVDVYVGSVRVDHKDQGYNPHATISPKDLRSGQVVRWVVEHTNRLGMKSVSSPTAGCVLP